MNEVEKAVDWKSLTIPASLPITTDYFPGLSVLQKEYGQNEYVLRPKDIQSDMRRSPIGGAINREIFFWSCPRASNRDRFFYY